MWLLALFKRAYRTKGKGKEIEKWCYIARLTFTNQIIRIKINVFLRNSVPQEKGGGGDGWRGKSNDKTSLQDTFYTVIPSIQINTNFAGFDL